jgi:hypothetical protein
MLAWWRAKQATQATQLHQHPLHPPQICTPICSLCTICHLAAMCYVKHDYSSRYVFAWMAESATCCHHTAHAIKMTTLRSSASDPYTL